MPANPNWPEITTTTLVNRARELADNVTNNNVLLGYLNERGRIQMEDGGESLLDELDLQENPNALMYSGYEQLGTQEGDVLTAAEQNWKQGAASVVMNGLEERQNMGIERTINLIQGRITNASRTLSNLLGAGVVSDGTGFSGKQITGLQAMVPDDPTTGVYGGIDRAIFTEWQSQVVEATATVEATNILGFMNQLFLSEVRLTDAPDLGLAGTSYFDAFWQSQQGIQRHTGDGTRARSGFRSLLFSGPSGEAEVFYDSNIADERLYFLNTDFVHWKVHPRANMTALPRRDSFNQDAFAVHLIFQGNLTCSNSSLQGVLVDLVP